MTKLTDTQLVILGAAAGRESHAILPLPKSLKANKGAAATVLKTLIKKELIEETPSALGDEHWRKGEAGRKIALTVTDAGLAALDGELAAPPSKKKKRIRGRLRGGACRQQRSKRSFSTGSHPSLKTSLG